MKFEDYSVVNSGSYDTIEGDNLLIRCGVRAQHLIGSNCESASNVVIDKVTGTGNNIWSVSPLISNDNIVYKIFNKLFGRDSEINYKSRYYHEEDFIITTRHTASWDKYGKSFSFNINLDLNPNNHTEKSYNYTIYVNNSGQIYTHIRESFSNDSKESYMVISREHTSEKGFSTEIEKVYDNKTKKEIPIIGNIHDYFKVDEKINICDKSFDLKIINNFVCDDKNRKLFSIYLNK
ncbi:MAG: hypothetical protein Terrestrivirus1_176 [Terrestrivirus sp.]|uniref:Uncharacterized protein n=1 Tax=Terrestrivirus sp. TaxID=2487775 RepID=A0A3G4ZKE2_9VIRU|nr:MAG: hypothetical protein Terrestrivirus1_176 [Terrestrivirus sp.]